MEIIIIWVIIYFLPTIIAWIRHKKNGGSVIVINLFLGWTFIWWVVAFAMAFWEKEEDEQDEPENRYISEEKSPEKQWMKSKKRSWVSFSMTGLMEKFLKKSTKLRKRK